MRILVIGVGSIGERHVRCLQHITGVSVSIVEINSQLRDCVRARYGVSQAYETVDAALNAEHDAAVVCTPAHTHVPIAIQCARRGIHLLIEKPLSVSLDRVDELASVAHANSLVVAVAYVLRCNPILAAMREVLVSGRFGRPVELVAVAGQHFPTYRPAYRDVYYAHRSAGGGAIQDALTHLVNTAEWLVGPITKLTADAEHLVLPGVSVEDTVHVIARHGAVMASYSLNQHQAPNEFALTVNCERGTVQFAAHRHHFRWMTEPAGEWQTEQFEPIERDSLFIRQAERFLAAIHGAPPLCSLAEGEQTLRVNLAALAAAESHTWLNVTR